MAHILHTARKLRRKLLKELERQQQDESRVVSELRNSFVAINREILQQIAVLLESYQPGEEQNTEQRELFQRIAPLQNLEDWLSLRKQEMAAVDRLASWKTDFERANQAYRKVAPLGPFSKWMKDDPQKKVIEALKVDRDRIIAKMQETEQELTALRERIRPQAEAIFRSAMSSDGLQALQTLSSPVMPQIQRLVARLRDEPTALWTRHSEAQKQSLQEIVQIVSTLSNIYENQSLTSEQIRPGS